MRHDTTVARVDPDLLRRYHHTIVKYLCLGNEVFDEPQARYVRNLETPRVYDSNFVAHVRATDDSDIDAVMARMDELFAHCDHRQVVVDPWTPDRFLARLLLDGFSAQADLGLLLDGDRHLTAPRREVALREMQTGDEWASFAALLRADHEEQAVKQHRRAWDQEVTDQMVRIAQNRARDATYYLASIDGADCAYFHAWPGTNSMGKVEDLFTLPEYRHRGAATALIHRCVDTARDRGAADVMIGARANDTPKHMYDAMGFRPFTPMVVYLRAEKTSG